MRLLHTSDWHIGRALHGTDLLGEQEQVLGRVADVVAAEGVDVVLVAGDVYDRAVPSADATAVLSRVVARMRRAGATVVLTPGNHDSARRLGAFSELLAAGGLHVRAETPNLDEPVLISDQHGDVAIYACPTWSRRWPDSSWVCPPHAATRRSWPRPWTGCAPTSSSGRVPAPSCWRTRSSAAACRVRANATSVSVGWTWSPPPCSTGSTTSPSDTCTGRRRSRPACATAAPHWPTPSGRPGRTSRRGWSTSTPAGWPTSGRCRCRPRARSPS